MMMDGWQELSGIATPNAKGLDLFWQKLREKGGGQQSKPIYERMNIYVPLLLLNADLCIVLQC
jgi:hypothetical protein